MHVTLQCIRNRQLLLAHIATVQLTWHKEFLIQYVKRAGQNPPRVAAPIEEEEYIKTRWFWLRHI
jgi:hypothetical protein